MGVTMRSFFKHLWAKRICFKQGHDFVFESSGLIGDWIRCSRCHTLDEYIPGTHEPKGYNR